MSKPRNFFKIFVKAPCKPISSTKETAAKNKASKLRKSDYHYVLQPKKADHQGSETRFTDFRRTGLYIVEKLLPKDNSLVREIGTNETQVQHRMRLNLHKPYPTYKTRHKIGNWILESSLNMIICTAEHGSLILESSFFTTSKMNRANITNVKRQWNQTIRLPKCVAQKKQNRKVQKNFPPNRRIT